MSKIVRISDSAYNDLTELENKLGFSKQRIIEEALEAIKREMFFKKLNEECEELQQDPQAWQDYLDERNEWESASNNLKDE